METSQRNGREMNERHYDVQLGQLQVTVEGLKGNFEEFKEEQRNHNAAVIERLDTKINGKIGEQSTIIGQHSVALATLVSEVAHLKSASTTAQIPMPTAGMKATVEVSDADLKPLTRRDLQVAVAVTTGLLTLIGLIFKFWPVADAASKAAGQ